MRLAAAILLLMAGACWGHGTSTATLRLWQEGERVAGAWEIGLGDLELVVGLDGNGDGSVSWGELREREAAIGELLAERVKFDSRRGVPGLEVLKIERTKRWLDEVIVVVPFRLEEGIALAELGIEYGAIFAADAGHRALLVWGQEEEGDVVFRFSAERRQWRPVDWGGTERATRKRRE